jgi:hypothetical protein
MTAEGGFRMKINNNPSSNLVNSSDKEGGALAPNKSDIIVPNTDKRKEPRSKVPSSHLRPPT